MLPSTALVVGPETPTRARPRAAVTSPWSGERLADVELATEDDADRAAAGAVAAFAELRREPSFRRAARQRRRSGHDAPVRTRRARPRL